MSPFKFLSCQKAPHVFIHPYPKAVPRIIVIDEKYVRLFVSPAAAALTRHVVFPGPTQNTGIDTCIKIQTPDLIQRGGLMVSKEGPRLRCRKTWFKFQFEFVWTAVLWHVKEVWSSLEKVLGGSIRKFLWNQLAQYLTRNKHTVHISWISNQIEMNSFLIAVTLPHSHYFK